MASAVAVAGCGSSSSTTAPVTHQTTSSVAQTTPATTSTTSATTPTVTAAAVTHHHHVSHHAQPAKPKPAGATSKTATTTTTARAPKTTAAAPPKTTATTPAKPPAKRTPKTTTTAPPATTAKPPPPSGVTVDTRSSRLGTILVGPNGRTLYLFEKDKGPVSTCYGPCASVWPPFDTVGTPRAGPGVQASLLGTTKRTGGKTEVTYAGHPLYFYAGDGAPGQTTGQGLSQFGAPWFVLSPSGGAVKGHGG